LNTVVISSCGDNDSEASLGNGMMSLSKHQANVRKQQAIETATALVPASTLAAAPGSTWQEVLVGWKNTQGRLAANSESWVLQHKAKEVLSVTYADLRSAMQKTHVPGVAEANNKDDLIRIMCKFNCVYSTSTLPMISLGSSKSTPSTAVCAPSNQQILVTSDSDAPISRAAIRQAKEAAAEAAKPTASEWRTRLAEQAAAKRVVGATAASKALSKKQKAATAQSDCTGSPKYDALCVCDFCMI
jgi:hypothetical protein